MKAEAVAMDLAARAGVVTTATALTRSLGRDVLLVERFDRTRVPGERRLMVSALTILGLDEFLGARHAGYADLAAQVRSQFTSPRSTLHKLFRRIVVDICVSNTDDHARNHAAFWDGRMLTLTPAYAVSPMLRSGDTASQAMAIAPDGNRTSRLHVAVDSAATYDLTREQAGGICEHVVTTIQDQWDDAADAAELTQADRALLWRRLILNPAIHDRD